jgi:hypothetical protein
MNKQDILRLIRLLLLMGAFVGWLFFLAPRVSSGLLMLVAIVFGLAQFRRPRLSRWALGFFIAALLSSLSPVDLTFHNALGAPHLVPYACGLPSREGIERHKRGEVYLSGSCLVYGNEPKYVLVW